VAKPLSLGALAYQRDAVALTVELLTRLIASASAKRRRRGGYWPVATHQARCE
jgi:hypothetical protein